MSHGQPDLVHEEATLLGSPVSEFYEEEDQDHARQISFWKKLPWWKRPSPYWLISVMPFGTIAHSSLIAPKVALYTTLACRIHRPEYVMDNHSISFPLTTRNRAVDVLSPHVFDDNEAAIDTISAHLSNSTYASLDFTQNDPDSQQKCASDPLVQAAVARLSTAFTTSMGILTCLTTAWWSSLSDRYGRRIVIFASACGLFAADITHVITAWFADVLPGGYWFPLLGFFIEGLCGGFLTGMAMTNVYIADTTDPSTRSRYFSLFLGVSATGIAVGPVLGGLLIHSTGTILSAFYFSLISHGIHTILILFILPESLTLARARGARLRRRQEKAKQMSKGRVLDVLKICTSFFNPLAVLLPEKKKVNPLKQRTRDWSLLFVIIAHGFLTSQHGSITYRYQYAAAQFHWTPETTSYFVSCIGVTHALLLAVILPLIIKYLKPLLVQLPSTQDDLSSPLPDSPRININSSTTRHLPPSCSSAFDLALARASVALDAAASLFTVFANTGTLYTLAAIIGSLSIGYIPAMQALVLDIYTNRHSENRSEVGKLYGALSVTQALASQIISPVLYGFIYANTVAIFPQAILVTSLCAVLLALACLLFVRIPSGLAANRFIPGDGNEENESTETPEILIEAEAVEGR